jgi:NADPH:quinone reductase-like Zn-dependent oxidoreductase
MKKVVIHAPGGYDRLRIEQHERQRPGRGQILIDVAAAGVNFADCAVRMGLYRSAREYVGWPITPGFEVAGTVAESGPDVRGPSVGTSVFAVTRFGGYASRVVVPRSQVFEVPPGVDPIHMAGFPTVFLTAYYALFELAHPRPGQRMLVHSSGGGVGGALVQLGKVADCEVTGVVGATHKVEVARDHGADQVIDTSRQDLWSTAEEIAPRGFDVILDANGAGSLRRSYAHLGTPGELVVYGFHTMFSRGRGRPSWPKLVADYLRTPRFNPLRMTADNRSILAFNLSYLFEETDLLGASMSRLLRWLEAGRIRPLPTTTYPIEAVAEAHRALETGTTVGKLVLTM